MQARSGADPIFAGLDAQAQDTLRRCGLVAVDLPLPPTVRDAANPAAAALRVFRSVPTIFNTAASATYAWDGRALSLPEQAGAAVHDHFGPNAAPPTPEQAASIAQFEQAELLAAQPPLTPQLQAGVALFAGKARCADCHGGPQLHRQPTLGEAAFRNTGLFAAPGGCALPARTLEVRLTADAGWSTALALRGVVDPGRLLISGNAADLGKFDVPALLGVANADAFRARPGCRVAAAAMSLLTKFSAVSTGHDASDDGVKCMPAASEAASRQNARSRDPKPAALRPSELE